jgi:hypothetical protein
VQWQWQATLMGVKGAGVVLDTTWGLLGAIWAQTILVFTHFHPTWCFIWRFISF